MSSQNAGPTPAVCVTLVLYNSEEHLPACLRPLRTAVERGLAEVVVVDNDSPDGSILIVQRDLPEATIIRAGANLGFAGGCNLAWPSVQARYWLLLNPDAVVEADNIHALVNRMDADPDVGIASPWLRDPGTADVRYPGRGFPSISRTLLEMLRLHRLLPARTRGSILRGPYMTPTQLAEGGPRPDWVPGTAMIVRREAVEAVGVLDEQFFLYGEDVEWCWRMRRGGWKIAAYPDVVVDHHESSSTRRTWSDDAVQPRIVNGLLQSSRAMRGRFYARAFGLLTVAALSIESVHPGWPAQVRERYRSQRRTWWEAVRRV